MSVTTRTKRPRIQRLQPTPFKQVVDTLAALYNMDRYDIMKIYRGQDYNLENTRMILNLKNRGYEHA